MRRSIVCAEVSRWLFEVWNEPNLAAFWTGSQADYFRLYAHAARAVKGIDPSLQVGGPATANNAWIPEMLAFCRANDVPIDFVSTHHYPTDSFGKPGDDPEAQPMSPIELHVLTLRACIITARRLLRCRGV